MEVAVLAFKPRTNPKSHILATMSYTKLKEKSKYRTSKYTVRNTINN